MFHERFNIKNKQADSYIISLGPVKLVFVYTNIGMLGCGAFDVKSFNRFDYPAAKVVAKEGKTIETVDDIFLGTVKEVSNAAKKLGIEVGMSGMDALEKL